ncbi:MAG TPA: hypothetical protein VKU77_38565 [Streptosporangiaceae bacterium]|nr:hypothetical protein [Streptosporangiaceae bacterium]
MTGCGFAVAAIDTPGFGDRAKTAADERLLADLAVRRAAGEPVAQRILRYSVTLAERAVPEWQAVLDGRPRRVTPARWGTGAYRWAR